MHAEQFKIEHDFPCLFIYCTSLKKKKKKWLNNSAKSQCDENLMAIFEVDKVLGNYLLEMIKFQFRV
jgi:hypothetical protein